MTWANTRKALLKETLVGPVNGLVLGWVGALVVVADEGQPGAGVALWPGDGDQHVHRRHGRDADSAGIARDEGRSCPGQFGVHHDVHRRGRVRTFLGLATVFLKYLTTG